MFRRATSLLRVRPAKMVGLYSPAILAGMVVVLLFAADASACPTCKDGLGQADPHGRSIAAGYYYSILFMMSMPFIILTTFGGFAYRSVKKAQAQRNAVEQRSGDA